MCVQYAMMRAQRTSCLNTDDSWMYEDGHDEIVFSVAKACQLLGIGLCGTEGAYTAEVELLEVNMHPPGIILHTLGITPGTLLAQPCTLLAELWHTAGIKPGAQQVPDSWQGSGVPPPVVLHTEYASWCHVIISP